MAPFLCCLLCWFFGMYLGAFLKETCMKIDHERYLKKVDAIIDELQKRLNAPDPDQQ